MCVCVCVCVFVCILSLWLPWIRSLLIGWVYVYTWTHVPWTHQKYIWNVYVLFVLRCMCRHTACWTGLCNVTNVARGPKGQSIRRCKGKKKKKREKSAPVRHLLSAACLSGFGSFGLKGPWSHIQGPLKQLGVVSAAATKNLHTGSNSCEAAFSLMLAPLHTASLVYSHLPPSPPK